MASDKRQRQDQRRTEKLEAKAAEQVKVDRTRKRNRALWIAVPAVLLILGALFVGNRGGGDDAADTAAPSSTLPAATSTTTPVTVPSTISKELATKPKVDIAGGDPPKTLQIEDLVEGTGPEAVAGSDLVVQYVGVAWSTKEQFDASWDRNAPYTVRNIGKAAVIDGWNEGLVGVREGSRRRLVIPSEKAYGKAGGGGGKIKPDEALVFVVDVLKVTPPAAAPTSTP